MVTAEMMLPRLPHQFSAEARERTTASGMKVKAELPHVFLKHKNEKPCVEKNNVEKGSDSCTEKGEREGTAAVVLRGGLRAERHANAETAGFADTFPRTAFSAR